jgi:hypothetical protein
MRRFAMRADPQPGARDDYRLDEDRDDRAPSRRARSDAIAVGLPHPRPRSAPSGAASVWLDV